MRYILFFIIFSILTNSIHGQKQLNPELGLMLDLSPTKVDNFYKLLKINDLVNGYKTLEDAKKGLKKEDWNFYEKYSEEYDLLQEDYFSVGEIGCSWYCGGGPDSIFASSSLEPNKDINYKAKNIHDFSLKTAWVEGASGYGIGQSISYRFAKKSPTVTSILIHNGYLKSEKAWKDNSRVKTLKLYIDDDAYAILNLKDVQNSQRFEIGKHQGKKKAMVLKFEILEVYKGDKYEDVAISELEFDGTDVHCFAAGTRILTTNNKSINIEDLKIGDKILTFNELTKIQEEATILELATARHHNLYELDFEGNKIIMTDDHPIFIDNDFYAITERNVYEGMSTQKLGIGKQAAMLINGEQQLVKLLKIKKIENCQNTYTIVKLDKNRLFYANGICVGTEEITEIK